MKRRGERIVTSGLAWPVAMLEDPRQASTAIVEVECDPGQLLATVQHAGHHQAVSSIDLSSGMGDVVVTLRAQDDAELAEFILTHVGGSCPGYAQCAPQF